MNVSLLDWIVEGAELGPGSPDYAVLRSAIQAYLRTRLGEFDDPIPEPETRKTGPEPARVFRGPGETGCTRMPFGPSS